MTDIKFYNTLAAKKRLLSRSMTAMFESTRAGRQYMTVSMWAMPVRWCLFDVLVRFLRHHFAKVTFNNITDIDDQINARFT